MEKQMVTDRLYANILSVLERIYSFRIKFIGSLFLFLLATSPMFANSGERGLSELNETIEEIQQETVTGTVVDAASEEPLVGVTVLVRGTSIGTTTGMDGTFSLDLPDNAEALVFSFIGYTSQIVPIEGQTEFEIELSTDVAALEELVVTGYGVQRKSDVTGSVGIVTPEQIEDKPKLNVLTGLRGKVPGVNVYTNSGAPTGSNRVLIRGMGTINSDSEPLYVVDGVVMGSGIEYMNPNNIESIEVLKDASATAIYGSRGANGVILITTSRGGDEDGLVVSYNGSVSIGNRAGKMDAMNSEQFMEVKRRGIENATKYNNYAPGEEPVLDLSPDIGRFFDSNGNPIYDTDWQEEVSRTAISSDQNIGVQGGTENSSFGAFLNYTRNEGVLLNSWVERLSLKVAYDANPREWLTIGGNVSVNRSEENRIEEGGGGGLVRRTMIEFSPLLPVKREDGSWSQFSDLQSIAPEGQPNPVQMALEFERPRDRIQFFGNTYLNFQLLDNLEFRTQFGFNEIKTEERNFGGIDLAGGFGAPDGNASIFNSQTTFWQNENYLTYLNNIGPHRINSVLGASWQKNEFRNNNLSVEGFSSNFFKFNNVGAASIVNAPNSNTGDWTISSYFTRTAYTFDNKYSITFTGRADGSSRFGEANKWAFFPSIGLGWTPTNEDFMSDVDVIDYLRIRGSWGETGNTEIGLYNSLSTIGSGTTLISGERATISSLQRQPNPNLQWEVTRQWDIGVELEAFNQFLELEVDYYSKLTTDLILARPIPSTTGFQSVLDNIGSVSNKGVDVALTTNNVQSNNFSWSSTLNFNYNKNVIESLGVNDEDIFPGPFWVSGSQTILRVGESLGTFYGFERLGTWNTDEAAEAAAVGAIPGEAKRSENRKIIGNGLPDWTGSFIHTFNYKNWDFTADFEFSLGADIAQQFLHSSEDRMGLTNGLATQLTDSWTPDNQDTPIQQIRNFQTSGQNSQFDSHWVADGSYLRGNQFTLGHTLNADLISRLGLKYVRLAASIDNAFVITSDEFKGYDPVSTSWGGNNFAQNIFFYQYPKARTISFDVNVRF